MKLDLAGRGYFNYTIGGFWRSFSAAIIAFPIFLALTLLHSWLHRGQEFLELEVAGLRYLAGWLTYPLVTLLLVKLLDRTANYVAYVITINWLMVPQLLLSLVVSAFRLAIPPEAGALLTIFLLMLLVYYDFFISRTVLDLTAGKACLVVFIGLLVTSVMDIIFYPY